MCGASLSEHPPPIQTVLNMIAPLLLMGLGFVLNAAVADWHVCGPVGSCHLMHVKKKKKKKKKKKCVSVAALVPEVG